MNFDVPLVQLSKQDGKAIMALTSVSGQDLTRPDWEAILACGPLFGHRLEDGSLMSIAGIFPSGPNCAVLGAIMIHPDFKNQDLVQNAVEKCLTLLGEDSTAFLISDKQTDSLYEKLGFRTVQEIIRLEINGANLASDQNLSSIRVRDLVNIVKLDSEAFGGQRYGMLKRRIGQADKTAVTQDSNAKAIGYALAVPKGKILQIGPVVALDVSSAVELIQFLGHGHEGVVRLEIPSNQTSLLKELIALGLFEVFRTPVKSLNGKALPGNRECYRAIDSYVFC